MRATLRREQILKELLRSGNVHVNALAEQFSTSPVTIRNDLATLEKSGKVERFFGGAMLTERVHNSRSQSEEIAVNHRYNLNDTAKSSIACSAASLVTNHSTIIIDSGSTTHLLAKELVSKTHLTVITNNLAAASTLANVNSVTLAICGGLYRPVSQSIHGQKAEAFFNGVCADIAFIGADGLDPDKGITTFNEGYHVSQKMAQSAKKVVILADSSKLARAGFNQVLLPDDIDCLITDKAMSNQDIQRFQNNNIEVILAD